MRSKAQIVMSYLVTAFDMSGRTPRKAFWKFFAVWQPVAIILTRFFAPEANDVYFYLKLYCLYFLFMIPLFVAGARRLQDIGEPGYQIFYPIVPFGILLFCTFGMFHLLTGGSQVLLNAPNDTIANAGVSFAFFTVLYGVLFYVAFVPAFLIAAIVTCMLASNLLGQCMLPSEAQSNAYGPNPHEVPS